MKLSIVISSLQGGGAERVAVFLAEALAKDGWEISIITFDKDRPPFYPLPSGTEAHPLDVMGNRGTWTGKLLHNFERIGILRRRILRINPNIIISFMPQTNVLVLLATWRLRIPVVVTEHIDARFCSPGTLWSWMRSLLYPFSACIVDVSHGVLRSLPSHLKKHSIVIPNPVIMPLRPPAPAQRPRKNIISMGRLTNQKGFDLLLRAFHKLRDLHAGWDLTIWGEGECRPQLETMAGDLGLQSRVSFPGVTKKPHEKMSQSDLFVLPSRFEGFGIVLVEAMACGLPVISFDCPSGPGEIIRDGIDGILVPPGDVNALAAAMDRLMGNEEERKKIAIQAPEIVSKYGPGVIYGQWRRLLSKFFDRPKLTKVL